jgi:hypothetical protein
VDINQGIWPAVVFCLICLVQIFCGFHELLLKCFCNRGPTGPLSFEEFTNLRFKKNTHLSLKTELHEMRNMKQLGHWYWKCGFYQLMCCVFTGVCWIGWQRVLGEGLLVVRKIENVQTGQNNRPKLACTIAECGEM